MSAYGTKWTLDIRRAELSTCLREGSSKIEIVAWREMILPPPDATKRVASFRN
jgi:hypothetical protein